MPKITLNLEDTILQALKLKTYETKQSISELVNDALKASLQEDLEDLKSWEERKGEDTYDYEEFVELLKNMEFYKSKKLDIFSQTVCKA
jgi:metal-responsive CopG/Arc/MetJ family transcriptional regulator